MLRWILCHELSVGAPIGEREQLKYSPRALESACEVERYPLF